MSNNETIEIKLGDIFEHIAPGGMGFGKLVVVKNYGGSCLLSPVARVLDGSIIETNEMYRGARLFNKSTILNSNYFKQIPKSGVENIITYQYTLLLNTVDHFKDILTGINDIDGLKANLERFLNKCNVGLNPNGIIANSLNKIGQVYELLNGLCSKIYWEKQIDDMLLILMDKIKVNDDYLQYKKKLDEVYFLLKSSDLEDGPRKNKENVNSDIISIFEDLIQNSEKNDFISSLQSNLDNLDKSEEIYVNSLKAEILIEINKIEEIKREKNTEDLNILNFIEDNQEKINWISESYRCFHQKYTKELFNTLYTEENIANKRLTYSWCNWNQEDF